MYKRAYGLHKLSEFPQEDEKSRRAAGVRPRASRRFVDKVKWTISLPGVLKRNDALTADQLNEKGVYDALGEPWTASSVRSFLRAFLPYYLLPPF